MRSKKLWIIVIACLAVGAAAGDPSRRGLTAQPYTARDRAFFLDDATVQFVRPGLAIAVQSARVAGDGTISATFTVADPQGLALDRNGVSTPGPISLSFI